MVLQGLSKLPVKVTTKQALTLYQKVANLSAKLGRLNSEFSHSMIDMNLIELLALNESVQSTRVEGTQVTFADMIDESSKSKKSSNVLEVENYHKALELGIDLIKAGNPISTRLIQQIHSVLMDGAVRGTNSAKGEYRKIQNFIGPDNKIEHAVYIPVPANEIAEYMTNLEYFINGEHHNSFDNLKDLDSDEIILDENTNVLIKTAILHAQFESIHPFLDGNGRVGRMLIVLNTMGNDLLSNPVFFVSEEIEKEKIKYYNLLNGIRGNDPDWFSWIDFFIEASDRMAERLLNKLTKISQLITSGLSKIKASGRVTDSIQNTFIMTIKEPFVNAAKMSDLLNISVVTARNNLEYLSEIGLLDFDKSKKRNKTYVNYGVIRAVSE
ncbi:Fic family protein [Leuconostoc lactis]|uniref:Fic family protein n=1 Tax=Leuconostoc lactis TaxID=1246 RepID=UPI0011BB7478|nr:Fic family protein [Leuconostoc lactis]QEA48075.1 Fic family protein [Leuconostoc lactis]